MNVVDYKDTHFKYGVYNVPYTAEKYAWLLNTLGPEYEDGGTMWKSKLGFISFENELHRTMFILKFGSNHVDDIA
jgi:hypothetical protein